jgi:hypothetical protein
MPASETTSKTRPITIGSSTRLITVPIFPRADAVVVVAAGALVDAVTARVIGRGRATSAGADVGTATMGASDQPRQHVVARGAAGTRPVLGEPRLNGVEGLLSDQRFVRILMHDPLARRSDLDLLPLMLVVRPPAPDDVAQVGLVGEHLGHRRMTELQSAGRPPTELHRELAEPQQSGAVCVEHPPDELDFLLGLGQTRELVQVPLTFDKARVLAGARAVFGRMSTMRDFEVLSEGLGIFHMMAVALSKS